MKSWRGWIITDDKVFKVLANVKPYYLNVDNLKAYTFKHLNRVCLNQFHSVLYVQTMLFSLFKSSNVFHNNGKQRKFVVDLVVKPACMRADSWEAAQKLSIPEEFLFLFHTVEPHFLSHQLWQELKLIRKIGEGRKHKSNLSLSLSLYKTSLVIFEKNVKSVW